MTSVPMPICEVCVHLRAKFGTSCDAFPDGIPAAILNNEADHRDPIEGDHGVVFEGVDLEAEQYASTIFDREDGAPESLIERAKAAIRR